MSRSVVIDTATGAIERELRGDPTMLADQVGPGQSLWALGAGDDGAKISARWLVVGDSGEFAILPGAPDGVVVPPAQLHFVVSA